ncbi:uncharacterized protein LOC127004923 [Eriocheir sinensis]|uniref:uncharacterized protein LOC127004923 n=1 Tax=Eriocheir sinensis TaxID=95602 RepID=UPI0021C592EC|nr:uncharacterized protein LOC127004923 [Eriocheir sinensis]XP_050729123.1 uncharacterized protein LOC127004923 [Eriocheir sinensis]XP_050729124.1 uncharacterized protein LOC127004923 [Eriocheir sinensis]
MSKPHHPKDLNQRGARNTWGVGATGREPATAPPPSYNEATINARPPPTSPYFMPPSTAPTAPYPPTAPTHIGPYPYPTTSATPYPSTSTAPYPDPTSPPLHPTPFFSTPHGQSTKHPNYGLNVGPIHQDSLETGGAEPTDREPVVAAPGRPIGSSTGVRLVVFLLAIAICVGAVYALYMLLGRIFWW